MEADQGWRISRNINIAEVLTILTMAGAIMVFFFDIGKRVDRNELINTQQDVVINENKQGIKSLIDAIEKQRLESKNDLSRLAVDIKQTNAEQNAKIDRIYTYVVDQNSSRKPTR